LGVDLSAVIIYYYSMSFPTTISITARLDMQDPLAGFVANKQCPGARLTLGAATHEHRFTEHGESHRFTVTATLERGEHQVSLEFLDRSGTQGAIEILDLHLDGSPMGPRIYQSHYEPFDGDKKLQSHLYLGWPGRWSTTIRAPSHERHGGVGFA